MTKVSAIFAAALLFGGIASAETNTTLATPPGCYIGTGCDQNGWATSTGGGLELGLAAIIRGQGAPGEGSNPGSIVGSTYYVPGGPGTSPSLALWNFEFSINTQPGAGDTTGLLTDYTYLLTITDTTTPATFPFPFSFNPLSLTDNATGGTWGAQNSENLGFGNPGFNPNAADNYQFTLTASLASDPTHTVVNTDSINVQVTPEPSTITLAGLSIAALAFLRRRQTRRS